MSIIGRGNILKPYAVLTVKDTTAMADSDPDDDVEMGANGVGPSRGSGARSMASRPKDRGQARWEAALTNEGDLHESADRGIEAALGGLEEAGKRKRYALPVASFDRFLANIDKIAQRHHTTPARNHPTHDAHTRLIDCHDRERPATYTASPDH